MPAHRGSERAGDGAGGRRRCRGSARGVGGGRAGAAGHRARRRLRPDVRAAVGAAAGAGARLSVAARRGAELPSAAGLAARRGGAAGAAEVDGPFGRFSLEVDERRWRRARAIVAERHARAHRADDYPRFRAFLGEVDAALGNPIGVVRAEAGGIMRRAPSTAGAARVTFARRGRGRAAAAPRVPSRPAPPARDDAIAGWDALAEGGRADAQALFDRRLRAAPRDAVALFGRASIDYERGRSEAARTATRRC